MHRRHFLVKEVGGDYQLREIDPVIANAIGFFGIISGQCYSVESEHWTFYFMNFNLSKQDADQIASELTQDFLAGNR